MSRCFKMLSNNGIYRERFMKNEKMKNQLNDPPNDGHDPFSLYSSPASPDWLILYTVSI